METAILGSSHSKSAFSIPIGVSYTLKHKQMKSNGLKPILNSFSTVKILKV